MNQSNGNFGIGRLVGVAVLWVLLAGGAWLAYALIAGGDDDDADVAVRDAAPTPQAPAVADEPAGGRVKVGIAYGTEKKRWLQAAVELWNETPDAKRYEIDLIPMGSVEGARAVVGGDERVHVWSPASGMYRDVFENEWRSARGGGEPILSETELAITPMVFVFWDERYEAFREKYGEASFETISAAAAEPEGWKAIAGRPEWGYFKFGHTHPNKSNSGLMTLVLMAYDLKRQAAGAGSVGVPALQQGDVLDRGFLDFIAPIEKAQGRMIDSTGTLMRDMVLRGPSTYDGVMVYESVALDYAADAEGRYGRIRVVYPPLNIWNDNPYYVLDVPWSTERHRAGATAFGEFLMSEPVQRLALEHGFRPGNVSVATGGPDSPFERYADYGITADAPPQVPFPPAAVLRTLQEGWERRFGG